jgi:hypothetical protein
LDTLPVGNVAVLRAIGNKLANSVLEHNAPRTNKPQPNSSHELKVNWIKQKYEQKKWLPPLPVDRTLSAQLLHAVMDRNMEDLLKILPRCTEKDINSPLNHTDHRTALHIAASSGATEVVQLLIWYNADIQYTDQNNYTPLWYAEQNGAYECRDVLLGAAKLTISNSEPMSSSTLVSGSSYMPFEHQQPGASHFRASDPYSIRPMPSYSSHNRTVISQTDDFDTLPTSAI